MKRILLGAISVGALLVSMQSGPAEAADMAVKAPMMPPPALCVWCGWYVGINVGGKWADTNGDVNILPATGGGGAFGAFSLPLGGATSDTVVGGGQIGYNWQSGPVVFGVEGDFDGQRWRATRTETGFAFGTVFVPGDSFSIDSHWQASVRGRLGYAWDRTLIYATGGLALSDAHVNSTFVAFGPAPATFGSDTTALVGGTVGGGLEYAMTNYASIGVEGRYTWYGTHTFNGGTVALGAAPFTFSPVNQSIRLNTSEVLAKLNFKFGMFGH